MAVQGYLLNLKKGIEFIPGVVGFGRRPASARHEGGIRLEVITVIGGFFVAGPFGLRLTALIILAAVVELAIAADMQVGVAFRAGAPIAYLVTRRDLDRLAAFPAVELHKNSDK
jgi:hypothetical protein